MSEGLVDQFVEGSVSVQGQGIVPSSAQGAPVVQIGDQDVFCRKAKSPQKRRGKGDATAELLVEDACKPKLIFSTRLLTQATECKSFR